MKICRILLLSMVALHCLQDARQALAERLSFERPLMGTSVEMIVWGPGPQAVEEAVKQAYAEIQGIEARLSVRTQESEVSDINRSAGQKPVEVSAELFVLIRESIRISRESKGAFDITVQGLGDLWDFYAPLFRVPDAIAVRERLNLVDYSRICLQEERSTVFLEKPGMRISLGGIGKGYAVDRAVKVLRGLGIKGGIVSAGGDLMAFGKREDGGAWKVGVRNPRDQDKNICVIPVSNMAVATSGDYERYRMAGGRRYHHIIDPRTGYPSKGCMSATVVAARALDADALATAVFVMGPEDGLAFLDELPKVEGLIVDSHGRITASAGIGGKALPASDEKPQGLQMHRKHNRSEK